MGKPTFQTCFLIPILRNSHERPKQDYYYYYNERSRKLKVLNMETAENLAFVNEIISFLSQYFYLYGADLLVCPVSKMIFPFFQGFMPRKKSWNGPQISRPVGVFMVLWPILQNALNCTQVFCVVCLLTMAVFHTI